MAGPSMQHKILSMAPLFYLLRIKDYKLIALMFGLLIMESQHQQKIKERMPWYVRTWFTNTYTHAAHAFTQPAAFIKNTQPPRCIATVAGELVSSWMRSKLIVCLIMFNKRIFVKAKTKTYVFAYVWNTYVNHVYIFTYT